MQVGKNIVTANKKTAYGKLFPLITAISGLDPLKKVSADYKPWPINSFDVKVNTGDYYNLLSYDNTLIKVVLCGDNGVGKSCLETAFIHQSFSDNF